MIYADAYSDGLKAMQFHCNIQKKLRTDRRKVWSFLKISQLDSLKLTETKNITHLE